MKLPLFPALILLAFGTAAHGAESMLDDGEVGKSAIPIAGYDDKSGWLVGAAGFLYSDREPGINAGLFAISNLSNFHSATLNYEQRGKGPWSHALHLLGERAFDNYYGEGDLTPPEGALFMRVMHFEARPSLLIRLRPRLRMGAFIDFRSRQEDPETRAFPDEASALLGLHLEWDSRDKLINTRKGDFFQLNISMLPGATAFTQASLDLRRFIQIRSGLILASRLVGAATQGQASYLFRYRLGGLDLLRGYKDNRFRGSRFVMLQEEIRWRWAKWVSMNVSFDAGAIADDAIRQLKASAQIGLRLGLPPDWGQKMRVDLGAGADQFTFQIQFGEIF